MSRTDFCVRSRSNPCGARESAKDSRVKEGRPHHIADRLVTNLEKGEKFNKDVCQVFLDDSEAVLRDGVDYEVRHSFDGPDHWHGSSVHSPTSPQGVATNSGLFYYVYALSSVSLCPKKSNIKAITDVSLFCM